MLRRPAHNLQASDQCAGPEGRNDHGANIHRLLDAINIRDFIHPNKEEGPDEQDGGRHETENPPPGHCLNNNSGEQGAEKRGEDPGRGESGEESGATTRLHAIAHDGVEGHNNEAPAQALDGAAGHENFHAGGDGTDREPHGEKHDAGVQARMRAFGIGPFSG